MSRKAFWTIAGSLIALSSFSVGAVADEKHDAISGSNIQISSVATGTSDALRQIGTGGKGSRQIGTGGKGGRQIGTGGKGGRQIGTGGKGGRQIGTGGKGG
jgi:hypothetical protein